MYREGDDDSATSHGAPRAADWGSGRWFVYLCRSINSLYLYRGLISIEVLGWVLDCKNAAIIHTSYDA